MNKSFRKQVILFIMRSLLLSLLLFGVLFIVNGFIYRQIVLPHQEATIFENGTKEFERYALKKEWRSTDIISWHSSDGKLYFLKVDESQKKDESITVKKKDEKKTQRLGSQRDATIRFADGEYLTNFLIRANEFPYYAGIGFAIILSLCLFLWTFIRQLSKKITYMEYIVKAIGFLEGGNLDYKLRVDDNDELSEIAQSINGMSISIKQNINQIKEIQRTNREIIGNLSHDIRTPLTILMGYLPILADSDLNEEQKRIVSLLEEKTDVLEARVDDLLETSTILSGQSKLHLKTIFISEIIQKIESQLFGLVNIEVIGNEAMDMKVISDEKLLSRVLDNLTSNIIKHSDLSVSIRIKITQSDEFIHMCVTNRSNNEKLDTERSMGNKISQSLMPIMGGKYITYSEGKDFVSELLFKKG